MGNICQITSRFSHPARPNYLTFHDSSVAFMKSILKASAANSANAANRANAANSANAANRQGFVLVYSTEAEASITGFRVYQA